MQIFNMGTWFVSVAIGINLIICSFAMISKEKLQKIQKFFHVGSLAIPTLIYTILAASGVMPLDEPASIFHNPRGTRLKKLISVKKTKRYCDVSVIDLTT